MKIKLNFQSLLIIAILLSGFFIQHAFAAEDGTTLQESKPVSLFSIIQGGGIIGYIILSISCISMVMIIENFISTKREKFLPINLESSLKELIQNDKIDEAKSMCKKRESFLGNAIKAGLENKDSTFGFIDMQTAMQEVSERGLSKFYRKLDYLNFIGQVSPMLGLFGTVTGMIRAFNELSQAQGNAQVSSLAGGITEALVTTCLGLAVAIPTMFFVTHFRNRVESLVTETECALDNIMKPIRKKFAA